MNALLKVADIARLTGAGRSTVYEWAETGKIPAFRVNGLLRFDPGRIELWLKACKESAPQYNNAGAGRRLKKGGKKQ